MTYLEPDIPTMAERIGKHYLFICVGQKRRKGERE